MELNKLEKLDECLWQIQRRGGMRVPAIIYASSDLIAGMDNKVYEQITNVACLPGIVRAAIAMPDAHWGYGFPIGGVAAFDPDEGGIISVGGVGYDISCGVRTMLTGFTRDEIGQKLPMLADRLFETIPSGVGSEGSMRLSPSELDDMLLHGAKWAVKSGYGTDEDLKYIEEHGVLEGADPSCVSDIAKRRQHRQIGTLGSGNHYLEIQYVEKIFDQQDADALCLKEDDIIISIHCGSRALGHQIGTDYIQILGQASKKYNIPIKERELVCAPIRSPEGEQYYKAMACGVNCALANRQVIGHMVREVFADIFPQAKIKLLYDVSHNTCKIEEHDVDGAMKRLYVHRKGATRAFGPGRKELPAQFTNTGQPVFIGGTMGTHSYILVGKKSGEALAWGSACHGAGRAISRNAALKRWRGRDVIANLARKDIFIRTGSLRGAAEEAPDAYKDVSKVVDAMHTAGLAKKVARVKPLACIKG